MQYRLRGSHLSMKTYLVPAARPGRLLGRPGDLVPPQNCQEQGPHGLVLLEQQCRLIHYSLTLVVVAIDVITAFYSDWEAIDEAIL